MNFLKENNFKNKRVIIRVDFNVPLDKSLSVSDDSRIIAALPTINYVLSNNGSVILLTHLGRPKEKDPKFSLFSVSKRLSKLLKRPVNFLSDCIGDEVEKKISQSKAGEIYLLENLRFYKEEVLGDEFFSKRLSRLGDVYINDAFGTSHRAHASTLGIVEYFKKEKYCGLLMEKEIYNLKKVFRKNNSPSLAIIGGAKISSKINVLYSLINSVDKIIIGGGMAYTFISSLGGRIGSSLIEKDRVSDAEKILIAAKEKNVEILLPKDSVNSNDFKNNTGVITNIFDIQKGSMGLDIGPASIALFEKEILLAKNIIWNGPMGVFEFSNFSYGTRLVAEAICKSTKQGAFSLVGGGDSVAAIKKYGLEKGISYLSTGGGAMLEFLEGKELPALVALS